MYKLWQCICNIKSSSPTEPYISMNAIFLSGETYRQVSDELREMESVQLLRCSYCVFLSPVTETAEHRKGPSQIVIDIVFHHRGFTCQNHMRGRRGAVCWVSPARRCYYARVVRTAARSFVSQLWDWTFHEMVGRPLGNLSDEWKHENISKTSDLERLPLKCGYRLTPHEQSRAENIWRPPPICPHETATWECSKPRSFGFSILVISYFSSSNPNNKIRTFAVFFCSLSTVKRQKCLIFQLFLRKTN